WAWGSGRADLFKWVQASGSFQGNGNGIKLGGNGTGGSSKGIHEAWRCVAFNNNKTGSVKGFDENSHKGGVKLVNCLAFGNGYDYMFEDCADASTFSFYNNVCLGRIEIKGGFTDSHNAMLTDPKNAWKNNALTNGFSESDYVSLSEADAKAPRAADGSLPTRFARLKSTSKLIDCGLDMRSEMQDEYPFTWQDIVGDARDLGPYEYQSPQPSGVQMLLTHEKDLSLAYRDGNVIFTVPENGRARVDVVSLQGQHILTNANILATAGGQYSIPLSALSSGVYILRLSFKGQTRVVKVSVL
ncbi:MAG: T9SS type A sorting domain-containing protein, partial [Prevotella sp.]|nr:T9SS type A sorting domain-containing protein [Prevotella sp.]